MCNKKSSLFDALMNELSNETTIRDPEILNDEMVSYTSDRTGCKALMSRGRYHAIISLVPGLQKRFIGHTENSCALTSDELHLRAVQEFLDDHARCASFNESYRPSNLSAFQQTVRGEVKSLLDEALDSSKGSCLNLQALGIGLRTGPGASCEVSGDAGTYGRLMNDSMSFTNRDVYNVYKACTRMTPLTNLAEAVRFTLYGDHDSFDTVAKFQSVPKTNEKNRGICTQPSGNMALQLSTHNVLVGVLKSSFDCDLETQQELNKHLAYYGSRGRKSFKNASWEFCTVDLSRASNFPLVLISDLFPENWFEWLTLIRSPEMEVDGHKYVKHMCSTMGNGFTFSLMTVLLSAIVKVLYSLANLPLYDLDPITGVRFKTWAVYGDDIIVDKSVFNALLLVLDGFGFLVNSKKTFSTGLFRESCGGDYYDGYPVRPVFLETLDTQADIFSLINRLVVWGVTHSVDLTKSLAVLRRAISTELRIPNWEDVSCGLHVPYSHSFVPKKELIPYALRKVYESSSIDGRYYLVLEPDLKQRHLWKEKTRSVKYSMVENKEVYSYESTVIENWNVVNEPGALLCTMEGSLRRGQYGVRSYGPTSYKSVWKLAPSWGDPTLSGGTATRVRTGTTGAAHKLWEEYVRRNLFPRRDRLVVL